MTNKILITSPSAISLLDLVSKLHVVNYGEDEPDFTDRVVSLLAGGYITSEIAPENLNV